MIYIYTLSDPNTNEIRYVGKTTNLKRRYYLHKAESKTSTTHKSKWFAKLLSENRKPLLEILDEVNEDDWQFWGKYWINQIKVWGFNLCNLTDGGDGIKVWTDEMRKKMSEIKNGCEVWNKGIPMSEEAKMKLSKSKIGKPSVFKGKKHTDKFKENKSKQMKGVGSVPIKQFDLYDNLIAEWVSAKTAGDELKISNSCITQCCKGNRNTHKGFKWQYKD